MIVRLNGEDRDVRSGTVEALLGEGIRSMPLGLYAFVVRWRDWLARLGVPVVSNQRYREEFCTVRHPRRSSGGYP